jgi:hypothetical protein
MKQKEFQMKRLLLVIALTLASVAQAAEMKLLDIASSSFHGDAQARFNVNLQLGRAWVETTVTDHSFEQEDVYRSQVAGLSFDQELNAIVLEREGQLIECAEVTMRGRSVLRHTRIRPTNCSLESRFVTVMVDDGFTIKKQRRLQVFLVTK